MKLSEAILKGALLRGQCTGDYAIQNEDGEWETCALGAAYEGCTGALPVTKNLMTLHTDAIVDAILDVTGIDLEEVEVADNYGTSLFEYISDENDDGTSRESIAHYLEEQGL